VCPDVAITIIEVVEEAKGKEKREGTYGKDTDERQ
jgi:hypothetical protein